MGQFLSSSPLPYDSNSSNPTMSSPNPESADPQNPKIPLDSSPEKPKPVVPDRPNVESSNSTEIPKPVGEGEEEEEGECGFCLFMKAGGCKETFVAWENCLDEAEKTGDDIGIKCVEVTAALKRCMEAHADYYEPILRAEKAAHEEAIRELENEKAAAKDSERNLEQPKEDLKINPDQSNVESSNSGQEEEKREVEGEGEEEEEEGECGFCLFMKGGGCKETFVAWENCVDEAGKTGDDVAEKCMEPTSALKKCMEAHADYYEPILRAEKATHEEAVRELENEKAAEDSERNLEAKEDMTKN